MRSVTFSDGCNLEGVTLPRAGGYRLVTEWPNRLQHLRRVSKSWGEAEKVEAEVYVRAHEGKRPVCPPRPPSARRAGSSIFDQLVAA